jgi:hypothetical protein
MSFPPDGGSSSYPANLQAIWFPTATAQAAITACDHAAAVLATDLAQRPGQVADARDSWSGPHRREFDSSYATDFQRLHDVRERIVSLSRAIGGAVANVAAENQLRANRRADYDRDNAVSGPH